MLRTFALIPAAGKSRRMGRSKLSLPLWEGGGTVLEAVIAAVRAAGVDEILVVLGPDSQDLAALAAKVAASVLVLAADTPDMRATVEQGLQCLEQRHRPQPDDGWLLLPADHPCVEPDLIRQLLMARLQQPDRSIIVPTYHGQRGHPVWIGWRHVSAIRGFAPKTGLNTFLRQQADVTLELEVQHPSVLWDLDTPEDYERLRGSG
jgi:molybdenum cofactor cytidylyltransferase